MFRQPLIVAIAGMIFMLLPTLAMGNAPPIFEPEKPDEKAPIESNTTDIQIVVDAGHVGPPTLSIPSDVAGKKGVAPIGSKPSNAPIPPINMIVIGVALSLAVLLGGYWLLKQNSLSARLAAVIGALIVGSIVITQYAQADIAPPYNGPVAERKIANLKAVVSTTEGDKIVLTLSPTQLKELGGKLD